MALTAEIDRTVAGEEGEESPAPMRKPQVAARGGGFYNQGGA